MHTYMDENARIEFQFSVWLAVSHCHYSPPGQPPTAIAKYSFTFAFENNASYILLWYKLKWHTEHRMYLYNKLNWIVLKLQGN